MQVISRALGLIMIVAAVAEGLPADRSIGFDYGWRFIMADPADAHATSFDDSDWRRLDLPHDWSIEGPFDENNPAGGEQGYLPGGIGWYRKEFTLPDHLAGKKVLLQFDGIYWQSRTWINGQLLGFRPSGYASFYYDLTDHLRFDGRKNVLAVRVDNSVMPNERWYTGSGIYRHTRLVVTDPLRLTHWGTFVFTDEVTPQGARVNARIDVTNDRPAAQRVNLTSRVLDPAGRQVGEMTAQADIQPGKSHLFNLQAQLADPELWSPDTPNLYRLETTLAGNGETLDAETTTFGIRTIRFDPDQGLFVNDQPTLLKGMCNHEDLGPLGSRLVDRALERRLLLLKEMGCNALRTSHNPPAPELLEMADRLGFLVVAEAFDKWRIPAGRLRQTTGYHDYFDEWHKRDLTDFITRDRNHPCIIMWGLGNEIAEQGAAHGAEIAKELKAIIRELDPTRPVTAGLNSINRANENGLADALDVVGYNGWSLSRYEQDHQRYPDRKMYGSEIPHSRITRGVYKTTTDITKPLPIPDYNMGDLAPEELFPEFADQYRSSYDNSYVRISAQDSWRICETRDYVAGEFRWTGFDYLGEADYAGGWPARSGDKGVFDLCGFKKDVYYFYQSRWTDRTVLHLLPHWTWPGKQGKTIPVWCYTNCDAVELFLDGRSLGRKTFDPAISYHLEWQVSYQPGTLSAVGFKSGIAVAEFAARTAAQPARLVMVADRDELETDGRDAAHLTVTVVDAAGNLVPHADNRVTFTVEGPARIAGIGNGNILSHHDFQGDTLDAFHGMCLAIIQPDRNASSVLTPSSSLQPPVSSLLVTARAPGLEPATVRLRTAPACSGNPVLPGWYADPEATIFGDQYWIFPTWSDEFDQPAPEPELTPAQRDLRKNAINPQYPKQTFFDAFSSPDLVDWTRHPRVLSVENVSWAAYALWAPSIVHANDKYYLFFSANDIQNDSQPGGIGVAVADQPRGPYRDALGKPLINTFHNNAQPIDGFVFRDDDGQHYLYYGGWRHCNVARLADDLLSIVPFDDGETFKEITPDNYVEGPFVLKRNGRYYLMWSEGGWGGPDYSVAYAIADAPTGPFLRIGKILQQDPAVATGAGHHSVIAIPHADEHYIVYHRRPLGSDNPHHRVTCIDRLTFDPNGRINPVTITHKGVPARPLAP